MSIDIEILFPSKVPKNRSPNGNRPFILVNCHLGPEKKIFCQGVDLLADVVSSTPISETCIEVRVTALVYDLHPNRFLKTKLETIADTMLFSNGL